jgi:hypothetical protein
VPSASEAAAVAAAVALVYQHAHAMEDLEAQAVADTAADLAGQLAELQRAYATQWVVLAGSLTAALAVDQARDVAERLARDLLRLVVDVRPVLHHYARLARDLATVQAVAEVLAPGTRGSEAEATPATGQDPEAGARDLAARFQAELLAALDHGVLTAPAEASGEAPQSVAGDDDRPLSSATERLVDDANDRITGPLHAVAEKIQDQPPTTFDQVNDAFADAHRAVKKAEAIAAQVVNTEANAAVAALADDIQARRLWIAERDACVHCLAYSGLLSGDDGGFPVDRTFGDRPLVPWPDPNHLPGPPLHPNCRCRIRIWIDPEDVAEAFGSLVDFPAALRREAQRSILKGWRLATEPEPVRVRAAAALLQRGLSPMIATSVRDYARRAVRKGGFPTSKVPVPGTKRKRKPTRP